MTSLECSLCARDVSLPPCVLQAARSQARRVRSSHVCEMAASLAVDLRGTAKALEEGACGSFEGLQGRLQALCRRAIDAYMEQQGDEGPPHCPANLCVHRPVSFETQSCVAHRFAASAARALLCAHAYSLLLLLMCSTSPVPN